MSKIISIGSDHRGFELKEELIKFLQKYNYDFVDYGPTSSLHSVDYPDYAKKVAKDIVNNEKKIGVLICSTGIGISMAANRVRNARAAICHDIESVKLARMHNDANILVLGAKYTNGKHAEKLLKCFLNTKFECGRHIARVVKIDEK